MVVYPSLLMFNLHTKTILILKRTPTTLGICTQWTGCQSITGPTQAKQPQMLKLTPTVNLKSQISHIIHSPRRWHEARGEASQDLNREPSCFEATVLVFVHLRRIRLSYN